MNTQNNYNMDQYGYGGNAPQYGYGQDLPQNGFFALPLLAGLGKGLLGGGLLKAGGAALAGKAGLLGGLGKAATVAGKALPYVGLMGLLNNNKGQQQGMSPNQMFAPQMPDPRMAMMNAHMMGGYPPMGYGMGYGMGYNPRPGYGRFQAPPMNSYAHWTPDMFAGAYGPYGGAPAPQKPSFMSQLGNAALLGGLGYGGYKLYDYLKDGNKLSDLFGGGGDPDATQAYGGHLPMNAYGGNLPQHGFFQNVLSGVGQSIGNVGNAIGDTFQHIGQGASNFVQNNPGLAGAGLGFLTGGPLGALAGGLAGNQIGNQGGLAPGQLLGGGLGLLAGGIPGAIAGGLIGNNIATGKGIFGNLGGQGGQGQQGGTTPPGTPGAGTDWDAYWQGYFQHNPGAYSFQGPTMNPYGNYSPYGQPMGGYPMMGNPYGQGGWNQNYNPMGAYQMNYYKHGGHIGAQKKNYSREIANAEIEGGETVVTIPELGHNPAMVTDPSHKLKPTSDFTMKAIGPNHAKASTGKKAGIPIQGGQGSFVASKRTKVSDDVLAEANMLLSKGALNMK